MSNAVKNTIIGGIFILVVVIVGIFFYRNAAYEAPAPEIPIEELVTAHNLGEQYINPRVNFTMHTPQGWVPDESGQLGTFAVFVPQDPDENNVLTSITVLAEEAGHLEDYVRETRESLPQILGDFTQIENRRVSLGDREGHLIGGRFIFEEIPIRTLRLIVVDGNRGYNITATALEAAWPDQKAALEASLLTFRP